MTREEFIEELSYSEYTYEIKGDKIESIELDDK